MRHFRINICHFLLGCMLALTAAAGAQSANSAGTTAGDRRIIESADSVKQGHLVFAEREHFFGTIKEEGGNVGCEFEFENTGDAPVVLTSVTASCGCTTPIYPEGEILPGEKGSIKVWFNPYGRRGKFDKRVHVRTNGKPERITLKILGTIVPKNVPQEKN